MTNVTEFQRESRRIDQLIWDTMSLVDGERILFCGSGNDAAWVRRAIEIGVSVTVIRVQRGATRTARGVDVKVLRGSTTMIPARKRQLRCGGGLSLPPRDSIRTFHALTVSELARVGRRNRSWSAGTALGSLREADRGASTRRAKYEAGAFEEYQPMEYWRKLLGIVKGDGPRPAVHVHRASHRAS